MPQPLWSTARQSCKSGTVPRTTLDDLVDPPAAAQLLGITRRELTSYRRRYADFPRPIESDEPGWQIRWHRRDLEAWQLARRPVL
jgi:hypothetical protein